MRLPAFAFTAAAFPMEACHASMSPGVSIQFTSLSGSALFKNALHSAIPVARVSAMFFDGGSPLAPFHRNALQSITRGSSLSFRGSLPGGQSQIRKGVAPTAQEPGWHPRAGARRLAWMFSLGID